MTGYRYTLGQFQAAASYCLPSARPSRIGIGQDIQNRFNQGEKNAARIEQAKFSGELKQQIHLTQPPAGFNQQIQVLGSQADLARELAVAVVFLTKRRKRAPPITSMPPRRSVRYPRAWR